MLIAGATAHAGFGEILLRVVVSLLLGQIPGVWIGARMSARYDGSALRWLLMAILAATAVKDWLAAQGIGDGLLTLVAGEVPTVRGRVAARFAQALDAGGRATAARLVAVLPGATPATAARQRGDAAPNAAMRSSRSAIHSSYATTLV